MATFVWQSTDGDGQNTASWGGTIPTDGDTGAFKDTSIVSLATGLTFSGDIELVTYSEYSGNIGAPSNGVIAGTTTAKIWTHRGTGTFYQAEAGLGTFVLDAPMQGYNSYELIDGGSANSLYVKSGRANIDGASSVTPILSVFGENSLCVVEEATTGLPLSLLTVTGGLVENKRDYTGATPALTVVSGGILDQTGILKDAMTVWIMGGLVRYHPKNDPSGEATGPNFFVYGGLLDLSESEFPINAFVGVGPRGNVIGNNVDTISIVDIDLRQDYP